jgi:hypothetical protein
MLDGQHAVDDKNPDEVQVAYQYLGGHFLLTPGIP